VAPRSDARHLRLLSTQLRLSIIELHRAAGGGHLGSSLSLVELLAVLFANHFRWADHAEAPYRGDRFVLSKGHAALGLYCALRQTGRIDVATLATFGVDGSPLEPHPNELREPAIHASTGSLGQGLSIAIGLALGTVLNGTAGERTFAVIGDGELNEGQMWEAARCAAFLHLANLIVVLDDNQMQQDGRTCEIMPVSDARACWGEMGWHCVECDGHDCESLDAALESAIASDVRAPRLLHIHTVKGRGIGFLEGRTESHFPPPISDDELALVQYSLRAEGLHECHYPSL
jgi:transketolase